MAAGGSHEEIIEKIDIGGVSLIRAAAKNHQDVVIVADPSDYKRIAEELSENQGFVSLETRKRLAAKAFQITAAYDASIGQYLRESEGNEEFPERYVAVHRHRGGWHRRKRNRRRSDENRKTVALPSNPAMKTSTFAISTVLKSFFIIRETSSIKAENSRKHAKAAVPTEYPLVFALVTFPTASNLSVIVLTV